MNLKFKFLFGDFMLSFIGFSIPMSIFYLLIYRNFLIAFIFGIIAGIIFASLMILFILVVKITFIPYYNELSKNNNIIYNSGANLFKDKNSIGGWMFFTDDAIYFHPHKFNFDRSDFKLSFNEIDSVEIAKTINCIIIKTKDENCIKMAVNDRKNVIKVIESKI